MISGILTSILGYVLFIGFILFLLGGGIYLIIEGIREYLKGATDSFHLFEIIVGCVSVMIAVIIVLKTFGL